MVDPKELIEAYFRNFDNIDSDDESSQWAHQRVNELVAQPEEAWDLALLLIAAAPSQQALAFIGADILEELLNSHGSRFLDRLGTTADSNKRFLYALANVWPKGPIYQTHQELMRQHNLQNESDSDKIARDIFGH